MITRSEQVTAEQGNLLPIGDLRPTRSSLPVLPADCAADAPC